MTTDKNELLLEDYAAAWNAHDLDAIMNLMTADCVFFAAGGDSPEGARIEGQDDVRIAFQAVLDMFPDAKWSNGRHFVCGDRGVSEWLFTATLADGRKVEVQGCDVLTLNDGKVQIKDSFRKNQPPPR